MLLFIQKVDDRIKTKHAQKAKPSTMDQVLIIDVSLYDCVDSSTNVGMLGDDKLVGKGFLSNIYLFVNIYFHLIKI